MVAEGTNPTLHPPSLHPPPQRCLQVLSLHRGGAALLVIKGGVGGEGSVLSVFLCGGGSEEIG